MEGSKSFSLPTHEGRHWRLDYIQRNWMTAFMEESGAEARICYSPKEESLRSHSKTSTFSEDPFLHPQFSNQHIPNPPVQRLTQQYSNVCDCNVYSEGTGTDNFIKKGGDAHGPRPVIFKQIH